MSGADFIGAIEPWPASAALPEGWSWGAVPQVAQVQAHKSRLLMQADALAQLQTHDARDATLVRVLYRCAAEWERWLLVHDHGANAEARRKCAHSALSLAELSGDLALVEKVLTRWSEVGPTHARFYRDGQKRLAAGSPAFNGTVDALRSTVDALVEHQDASAAEQLLAATENFARDGGRGELLALRALAMEVLGFPGAEVVRARFDVCIALPTEPHAIVAYMLALSRLTPRDALPRALVAGLRWFRDDLSVQATALALRDTHDDDAHFGESVEDQVARVADLAKASEDLHDVDYAVFYCAKHLWRNGARSAEAFELLNAALDRHPSAPTIRVFRALVAHELGRADAFDDLSAMLHRPSLPSIPSWLWLVVGEVFLRGQRWAEAVVAFRRGGVDVSGFDSVSWLNQYAVSLARSGDPDAARRVLERALLHAPHEATLEYNLDALRRGPHEALTPHPIDPFASARPAPEPDPLEYMLAA